MPVFAVLNEDNIVANVIVADSLEIAEEVTQLSCAIIEDSPVGIGWMFDDYLNTFINLNDEEEEEVIIDPELDLEDL